MNARLIYTFAALLGVAFTAQLQAQTSEFTYQGILTENGAPANGTNDFEFRLYDAATAGGQVGQTLGTFSTEVANGLFTVQLNMRCLSLHTPYTGIVVRSLMGFKE